MSLHDSPLPNPFEGEKYRYEGERTVSERIEEILRFMPHSIDALRYRVQEGDEEKWDADEFLKTFSQLLRDNFISETHVVIGEYEIVGVYTWRNPVRTVSSSTK